MSNSKGILRSSSQPDLDDELIGKCRNEDCKEIGKIGELCVCTACLKFWLSYSLLHDVDSDSGGFGDMFMEEYHDYAIDQTTFKKAAVKHIIKDTVLCQPDMDNEGYKARS